MHLLNVFRAGVCISASLGLVLSSDVSHARDDREVRLQPSSKWHLDYADDSCRIARRFGDGESKVLFYIERYQPGDSFTMVAAGKPLKTSRDQTYVQFGAYEAEQKSNILRGSLEELKPALIFSTIQIAKTPPKRKTKDETSQVKVPNIFGQKLSPEREAAVTWIRLKSGSSKAVILETGSLGEPMKAMRQCTADLLTHWGIDLEKHRDLANMPKPKGSPAYWLRAKDYPTTLLRQRQQGLVKFRLSIDDQGIPTQCHIQRSTRPEGFDTAVCEGLMKRARFEPARTRDGEAIASYWRSTVRFEIAS